MDALILLSSSFSLFFIGIFLGWFLKTKVDKKAFSRFKEETGQLMQLTAKEFENLGHKIFEDKSEKFEKSSQNNLKNSLLPFQERLLEFQKKAGEIYHEDIKERASLKTEIENVIKVHERTSKEAENLTKALKSDTKLQGNWGEFSLKKVLDMSGLIENQNYVCQKTFTTDSGQQRPDVVINLPDNKHLIIDSKVSLVHYEKLINVEDKKEKESFSKQFFQSLKNHTDDLDEKKYQLIKELENPDFIFMYIPLEGVFSYIIKEKPDFISYCFKKSIICCSPLTLMSSLKTVSSVWSLYKQNQNSKEIVKQVENLYDKFVGLYGDLEKTHEDFDKAQRSYESVFNKLKTGKGSLLSRMNKLKDFGGLQTTKSLTDKEKL